MQTIIKITKKLFSFVTALLLFFCPVAVQAEDIEPMLQEENVEAPSEEALNYLLSEDMYQIFCVGANPRFVPRNSSQVYS